VEARTEIHKLTVRLVEGMVVDPQPASPAETTKSSSARTTTLSQEMFFEALKESVPDQVANVRAFVDECVARGCQIGEASASISIRVQDREGRSWNLGSLMKNGDVWVFGLNQKDLAYGTDIGTAYMNNVASLVPGAYIRPPSSPTLEAELRMPKGRVRIADLMAVRDRWLNLIQGMTDEVSRVPSGD
jgi:hypothetical protein